jgi:tetratricopeptide (TPR) repeat protein
MLPDMFRLVTLGIVLTLAVGCQFNRQFAPISPTHIRSNEFSRQGIVALEQGDLAEAERQLENAVRWNKNDSNHRLHLAEVLWRREKHQEALQQLDEAVRRGGQYNASLHISFAEKLLEIREFAIAKHHADIAVRLAPQDHRSWALRGRAKYMLATHRAGPTGHTLSERTLAMLHEARADYLRAVSLAPNDSALLVKLATVQMRCGQPEQALATWLTIQNLYPQGSEPQEVLVGKTTTLAMLRRFDEAETTLAAIRQRGLATPELEWRLQETMIAARGEGVSTTAQYHVHLH